MQHQAVITPTTFLYIKEEVYNPTKDNPNFVVWSHVMKSNFATEKKKNPFTNALLFGGLTLKKTA